MNKCTTTSNLVHRLREQVGASGWVWHEIQQLLLEAAKEIERLERRDRHPICAADGCDLLIPRRK